MAGRLDRVARLLVQADLHDPSVTGAGIPWGTLRYPHTALLRSMLLDQGWSAAHVNKHLIALRMVLKEAWRLGRCSGRCPRGRDAPPHAAKSMTRNRSQRSTTAFVFHPCC
jgi:hypothetical protein